ncbi:hypothetical protein CNMCM6805_008333 [Aspergillus fumigatiaffinis]|uniref:F-box domain-containing protein n=1 Tax=Aspergillus fumigatiaffinis TaxID=340414 RepID=A0A8H4H378_9EURO|nr:hypothetical protein CNMCM6457_007566 [Aspergillus fumigatiaffinis]KAF4235024.1 hypothetical protein CNMCM6805_008333 [Aspergillus fumigatiaffinis]
MRLPPCANSMNRPRHICDLADELLSEILSFLLELDPPIKGASQPYSQHVSQYNGVTRIHLYGEKSDLDRFRLVCKRFRRIGAPRKFRRFVLRFSRNEFGRLEEFLTMQLACHVRYFTYMVRPFYSENGWPSILTEIEKTDPSLFNTIKRRLQDQQQIVQENNDLLLLRRAIASFSGLQQVKLLRLQDEADELLMGHIQGRSLERSAMLEWEPACTRAVTNLAVSLVESKCNSIRFVGPQMSSDSMIRLLQTPPMMFSALGARLLSLDINFQSYTGMATTMSKVSRVFHDFFRAARNLTAVHFGVPGNGSAFLPLKQMVYRVQWKRLQTVSLQGWCLDADDIITIVLQHKRQIRDIRLINVHLRDGHWRDVLACLREEAEQLERIDLHEIDYVRRTQSADHTNGSSSRHSNGNGTGISIIEAIPALSLVSNLPSGSPQPVTFDDDYMSLAPRGTSRRSIPKATMQKLRTLTVDDLGDDGLAVKREQIFLWEAWVLSSSRMSFSRP